MIDEPPDSIPLPMNPDDAYLQAQAGAELFGIPLQTWSPARAVAANAMGLGWPLPPEAAGQLRANGLYAGALRDTIIVTWLRTIPNASEQSGEQVRAREWNVQRATRSPQEAFEAATEWAAAHHVTDLQHEAAAEAYRHTLATLLGVAVSEFDPVPPPDAKAPPSAETDPNV